MKVRWEYAVEWLAYKVVAREDGIVCTIPVGEDFDSLTAKQRFVEAAREARVHIREHREDAWGEANA